MKKTPPKSNSGRGNQLATTGAILQLAHRPPHKSGGRGKRGNFNGIAIAAGKMQPTQTPRAFVVRVPNPAQTFTGEVIRESNAGKGIRRSRHGYVVAALEPKQVPIGFIVDKLLPGQRRMGSLRLLPPRRYAVEVDLRSATKAKPFFPFETRLIDLIDPTSLSSTRSAGRETGRAVQTERSGSWKAESTLTLSISGDWTAADFGRLMSAIERIYTVLYRFEAVGVELATRPEQTASLGRVRTSGVPKLRVSSIEYASPGFVSFTGSGEIFEVIRQLVKDLCGRNQQETRRRDIDLEAARLANERAARKNQLENAIETSKAYRIVTENLRAAAFSDDAVSDYARRALAEPASKVAGLLDEGKLVGVQEVGSRPLKAAPRALPEDRNGHSAD